MTEPAEPPAPLRLLDAELAYHRRIVEGLRASEAVRDFWIAYLSEKYQLSPGARILADGTIQAAEPTMPITDIDNTSEKVYFVTGTLTTTAVPLGANTQSLTELVIQADPNNTVDILIGDANSQGWRLIAGAEWSCPIRNPGLLYGRATSSTATYSLFGRYGG